MNITFMTGNQHKAELILEQDQATYRTIKPIDQLRTLIAALA